MRESRDILALTGLTRRLLLMAPMTAVLPPLSTQLAAAAPATLPPRAIPARTLPVPDTVSAALQAFIAAPYPPGWNVVPPNAAAWKELAAASSAAAALDITAIRERFKIKVEPSTIAGVRVFIITPQEVPAANRDRVLLHLP